MARRARIVLGAVAVYAAIWGAYVVKSAAGVDLVTYDAPLVGGHHGWMFPGSDPVVAWLRRR